MKIVLSLTLFWFQVFINSKAELNSNQDDPDPDYLSSPFNKDFKICDQVKLPKKRIVCYYRVDESFRPFNIDPCLCTHVIYSYVVIKENFAFVAGKKGDLKFLENLKQQNPNLKTLVSVRPNGKDLSSNYYHHDNSQAALWSSISNQTVLSKLARKVNEFIIRHKLDGIDLDWEYFREASDKAQKENLVSVIRTFKNFFKHSLGSNYSLTITTSKYPQDLTGYYDFVALNRYIDFVNVPAFHFDIEGKTVQHPARLHGTSDMENMDSLIDLVLALGLLPEKLTIGVPSYGIYYKLSNTSMTSPGSPSIPWEQNEAYISLSKICAIRDNTNWTIVREKDSTAPYIYLKNKWIGFDDEISIKLKAKYAVLRQLGGVALWNVNDDDPLGKCGYGPFPLLQNLKLILSNATSNANSVKPTSNLNGVGWATSFVDVIEKYGNVERVVEEEGQVDEFPCKNEGYIRHPKECSKFYRCVKINENKNLMIKFQYSCAQGLLFDDTYGICNWPSWTPPCESSEEIQPVAKETFTCPSYGYFQDPNNCEYFYYCSDFGKDYFQGYEFKCPFGLSFDEEKLLCNWKWLVKGCKVSGQEKHDTGNLDAIFQNLPPNFFNNAKAHADDSYHDVESADQLLSRSDDFTEIKYVDNANIPAEHRYEESQTTSKSRKGFARALKEQVSDLVESVGSKVKNLFSLKDDDLKRKDRTGLLADWLHNHNPFAASSQVVSTKLESASIFKPKKPIKEPMISIPVIDISHLASMPQLDEIFMKEQRLNRQHLSHRPHLPFLKPLSEGPSRLPSLNSVLKKNNHNLDVIALPVVTINKDKRAKGKWPQIQRRPDNGVALGTSYYKNKQNQVGNQNLDLNKKFQQMGSSRLVIPMPNHEEYMVSANPSTQMPIPLPKYTTKLNHDTTQAPKVQPSRHQLYQTSESIRSTINNQHLPPGMSLNFNSKVQNQPMFETLSSLPFHISSLNNFDTRPMEIHEILYGSEHRPLNFHLKDNQQHREILRIRVPTLLKQIQKQAEYHNSHQVLNKETTKLPNSFLNLPFDQSSNKVNNNQQNFLHQNLHQHLHQPQIQPQSESQPQPQFQNKPINYVGGQNLDLNKWQHPSALKVEDKLVNISTSGRAPIVHTFTTNNGFIPIKSDGSHLPKRFSNQYQPSQNQYRTNKPNFKVSGTSNQYQYYAYQTVTSKPKIETTSNPGNFNKKAKLLIIPVPDDHPQAQSLKDIERLTQEYSEIFPEGLNFKKLSELAKEKPGNINKEDYIYVVVDQEKIKNLTKISKNENKIKPLGAIALNRLVDNPDLLSSVFTEDWAQLVFTPIEDVSTTVAPIPKTTIFHKTTTSAQNSRITLFSTTRSKPYTSNMHYQLSHHLPHYKTISNSRQASRTTPISLAKSSPFTPSPLHSKPINLNNRRSSTTTTTTTTTTPITPITLTQKQTTTGSSTTEYYETNQESTTYFPQIQSDYQNSNMPNGHQNIPHTLYESIQHDIAQQFSSYLNLSSSSGLKTDAPNLTPSYNQEENETLKYLQGYQSYYYQPQANNETINFAQSWPTYPQSWYQYTFHPQPIYAQSTNNLSSLEYQYYPVINGYQDYTGQYNPQHLNSSAIYAYYDNKHNAWDQTTTAVPSTDYAQSMSSSIYISSSKNLENHKMTESSQTTTYAYARRMPSTEAPEKISAENYELFDSFRTKKKQIQIYRIQGANKQQVKNKSPYVNDKLTTSTNKNIESEFPDTGRYLNDRHLDHYHYTYGTAHKESSSNNLSSYTSTEKPVSYHESDYQDDPTFYNAEDIYLTPAKVQSLQNLYNSNLYNGLRNFSDGSVPEAACTRAGLFQHPSDCNKFYECYWDKYINKFTLHLFECPVKLAFDSRIIGCSAPTDQTVCVQY